MKKVIYYLIFVFTLISQVFLFTNTTYAQGTPKNQGAQGTQQAQQTQESQQSVLKTCSNGEQGIDTAIGCVPFGSSNSTVGITSFILNWAIGVAGGIAFLLILYGGFQIMTSSGDPQRLKAGQELLTAAISGLLMLIFSVFILRVIGVDILKIF